jgi:lipid-A-disaccharide synthase-like uncharacterized protein
MCAEALFTFAIVSVWLSVNVKDSANNKVIKHTYWSLSVPIHGATVTVLYSTVLYCAVLCCTVHLLYLCSMLTTILTTHYCFDQATY